MASGQNSPDPSVGKRKSAARSSKAGDESAEESGEDIDGRKAKRNRVSVSCRECKRRKIRCDRKVPACGPCEKRGSGSSCSWDIFSGTNTDGVFPPSIARTADLETLHARLTHVEAYLRTLPPSLANFRPFSPSDHPPTLRDYYLGESEGKPGEGKGKLEEREGFWRETEDAAVVLENGVFGANRLEVTTDQKNVKREAAFTSRGHEGNAVGSTSANVATPAFQRRFGGSSTDLTRALTSIVAGDRPLSDNASLKTHLNVEFDATAEEIEFARIEELKKILRAIPSRKAVQHLVKLYFEKVSWLFHHLHAPSFLIEVETFHEMCEKGEALRICPSFLALLLIVISISLDSSHTSRSPLSLDNTLTTPTTPSPLSAFSEKDLKSLPETWFAASQRALKLAEWETIPRVRTIQTIVLYTQYLQLCSPSRGLPAQSAVWLSAGIKIAQVLGLHFLGSNPEKMPVDDPAWPPGKNSVKRESAKRVWGVLVYLDWLAANSKNKSYSILPGQFDTDDPCNLNDSDLSPIDWKISPSPNSILTDSTSDRIRIALSRQVRKVFDAVTLNVEPNYDVILELDEGYRAILEQLPEIWKIEPEPQETDAVHRFQRHFALEGLHNRIFRLHRPFSTRGYSQDRYKFSTEACLKSARVVVVSTHKICFATLDIWYSYSHVMGAALVLFQDLFHSIDFDANDSEIAEKRETLKLANQIFSNNVERIASPSLQFVVQSGGRILEGLFRAEESRRMRRAARTLVEASGLGQMDSGEREDDEVESFAEVLKRVHQNLNVSTAPHRGTPPPTRNIPLRQIQSNSENQRPALTTNPSNSTNLLQTTALASTEFNQMNSNLFPTANSGYPFEISSPWPFPADAGNEFSMQFFNEFDLDGIVNNSIQNQQENLQLWNTAQAGIPTPPVQSVRGTTGFDYAIHQANGNNVGVGINWNEAGAAAQTPNKNILIDPIRNQW